MSLLATLGTIFALIVLFLLEGSSLTAGIVTATAFLIYQQIEDHVLNPVVMSRTVKVNRLLALLEGSDV